MGKMVKSRARELCWEYEGKGLMMGKMTTSQMKAFFDDRFIFKKMYNLYDCNSFEELARYLTRRTFVCGADRIPEDIVEDMISDDVERINDALRNEIMEVLRICTTEYKWKAFEKKFVTKQDIYDQYTDHSEFGYEWYCDEYRRCAYGVYVKAGKDGSQVNSVYNGEFFSVYETYVTYTWYSSTYVTKMAVVVPNIDPLPKEDLR